MRWPPNQTLPPAEAEEVPWLQGFAGPSRHSFIVWLPGGTRNGAIKKLAERLQRHPELRYRVADGTVTVEPSAASGFPVSLTERIGEWVVSFGGWHQHFESEDEAIQCFALGLTDPCRLWVHYRRLFPCCGMLEERRGDGWRAVSSTVLFYCPFWQRLWVEYFQHAIIRTTEPDVAADGGVQ